jgi:hypothetical protein
MKRYQLELDRYPTQAWEWAYIWHRNFTQRIEKGMQKGYIRDRTGMVTRTEKIGRWTGITTGTISDSLPGQISDRAAKVQYLTAWLDRYQTGLQRYNI